MRLKSSNSARVLAVVALALVAAGCGGDGEAPTSASTSPPSATEPDAADVVEPMAEVDATVAAFVEANELAGAGLVVVDRELGVVHERYWGAFDADRVSLVASSSKMITAGVLLRLHDDGLLDIEAPISDVVAWGDANPGVTVAQLLSNSSGLVGLAPDPFYAPYACMLDPAAELQACGEELFASTEDDADVVAPDTDFRYGGAQWQVAGAIAETVSERTWAQLVEEIYVGPCGTDSLAYNNQVQQVGLVHPPEFDPEDLPPTENPLMEGGAYLTAPDYARLLLMHLRDGECEGGTVLSRESVERMHRDRVGEVYGDADDPATAMPDPSIGYGMGWWVDRDTGLIDDSGAYGAYPWLDLEAGYGVYLVLEAGWTFGNDLAGQLQPLIGGAVADLRSE